MMLGKNQYVQATLSQVQPNTVGIELGVWRGNSTSLFAQKAARVYAVDSWSIMPYHDDGEEHGGYERYIQRYSKLVGSSNPEDFQTYYDKVYLDVLERFKDNPRVVVCRMTGDNFFKSFTKQVDWVYVDANHSYESCKRDLINSAKVIKKNGLLMGDDYGNKPGVKKAVDEFVKETGFPWLNFNGNQFKIRVA